MSKYPKTHAEWAIFVTNRITNRAPGVRVGQAYFNALSEVSPLLARGLAAGNGDPFYLDYVTAEAVDYVRRNWYIIELEENDAKNQENYS